MRSTRDEGDRGQDLSLLRRVLSVRTIGSIAFGIALLVLLFRVVLDIDFSATGSVLLGADLGLLAIAWLAYYATFPMRGFRWWFVLRRAGERVPVGDATEVVFIAWFVNCLVPAKLGDLYRAYLLKGNFGTPISRTVGTIFIERVADLLVMFWLALAAGSGASGIAADRSWTRSSSSGSSSAAGWWSWSWRSATAVNASLAGCRRGLPAPSGCSAKAVPAR